MSRLALLWLATIGLLATGEAQAAQVLLLDASANPGDATMILDDLLEVLSRQYGVTVLGPGFPDPLIPVAAPADPGSPVARRVDQARRELESFQLEAAGQTLAAAGRELDGQDTGEAGELLLQVHWLHVQLAMVGGEDAVAAAHLTRIASLAPWWEPPVGYLTPELREVWQAEHQRVVTSGARVACGALPAGTRVWLDGFEQPTGQERVVSAGRHLYHAERAGFAPARRWIELQPNQRWAAPAPQQPSWDDTTRALLRAALDAPMGADSADVLAALGALAGVELVMIAHRSSADPPGTVRAAAAVPGERTWTITHRSGSYYDLATEVAEALAGGAGSGPGGRVTPLLAVELGGAVRLGGPAEQGVSGGGGPALEIGGGVDLAGHLELRAAVGMAFAGPVALDGTSSRQRAYLIRVGAVVAPHVPLGRGSSLWFGGGGGLLVSGIVTTAADGTPYPAEDRGGYLIGQLGLDLPVRQGVTAGPSISYTHGWVPLQRSVPVDGDPLDVEATAARSLQVHLRITLGTLR